MTQNPWEGIEMPEGFDPANNPFLKGNKAGKGPDDKSGESRLEYIAKWAKPFETAHPIVTAPGFNPNIRSGVLLLHSKGPDEERGHLHGVDPEFGATAFTEYNTGGSNLSSPAGYEDAVFVGATNGLYSIFVHENKDLSRWEGLRKWDFPTSSEVASTPVVDDFGRVYFVTKEGVLYCLGAEDGNKIFGKEGTYYSIAISGDRIYAAGEENLYVLDAETGEELWKSKEIDTEVHNIAGLDDQTVVACLETGEINGYDISGTTPIWQEAAGLVDSIATAGNVLYAGKRDGEIIAINSDGDFVDGFGKPKVKVTDLNLENLSFASNIENGILHVSTGEELVAIDVNAGKQVGSLPVPGCGKPMVYNGTLYVPIGNGTKTQAYEIKEAK